MKITTESKADTGKSTIFEYESLRLSGVISTSESTRVFNYIFLENFSEPEIDLIHEKTDGQKFVQMSY